MNDVCTLTRLQVKKSVERTSRLTAMPVFLKMTWAKYFEVRILHSVAVQCYHFFLVVITVIALAPFVCETEHLSSASGLTAGTSR